MREDGTKGESVDHGEVAQREELKLRRRGMEVRDQGRWRIWEAAASWGMEMREGSESAMGRCG